MTRPVLPPSLADRAATLPSVEECMGFAFTLEMYEASPWAFGWTDEDLTEARQALVVRRAELARGCK